MKKESKIIHINDAKKKYKKSKQKYNDYKESKVYIEFEKAYIDLLKCKYIDTNYTIKKFENLLNKFCAYFDELYKNTKTEEFKKVKILENAIDYSVIGNGKKIRPFIMFVTFMSVIDDYDTLEYVSMIRILETFMLAIEIIHSFSLIHDDLPAIDNDELRRGKLSTWKKFGEDVAILTGDAMIFKAYSIILDMVLADASSSFDVIMDNIIKTKTAKNYTKKDIEKSYSSILNALCTYNKIAYALSIFTKASGNGGMIVGEMYDVLNTHNSKLTKANFSYMCAMKTGSLIGASAIIGAILAEGEDEIIQDISKYTMLLGYIYQLKDDILDEISDEKTLGKTVKSDKKNKKVTFVSKFGIDSTKEEILFLYEECLKVLDELDKKKVNTKILRIIVYYVVNRDR